MFQSSSTWDLKFQAEKHSWHYAESAECSCISVRTSAFYSMGSSCWHEVKSFITMSGYLKQLLQAVSLKRNICSIMRSCLLFRITPTTQELFRSSPPSDQSVSYKYSSEAVGISSHLVLCCTINKDLKKNSDVLNRNTGWILVIFFKNMNAHCKNSVSKSYKLFAWNITSLIWVKTHTHFRTTDTTSSSMFVICRSFPMNYLITFILRKKSGSNSRLPSRKTQNEFWCPSQESEACEMDCAAFQSVILLVTESNTNKSLPFTVNWWINAYFFVCSWA